jgi:uncharacterized membrane protein (DUF373 family)
MFKYFFKKNRKNQTIINIYSKSIFYILVGSVMIGHASRMIYQGVFSPNSFYSPDIFDIFFDWMTLLILGSIILIYTLFGFYKKLSDTKKDNKQPFKISIT